MVQRELFHPDLRQLDEGYLAHRSAWYSFFFPQDQRILWYGDCKRSDGDRGYGMYMTVAQYALWPDKHVSDIVAGPSK